MKRRGRGEDRDFAARQYASLISGGYDEQTARARLGEVLGEDAFHLFERGDSGATTRSTCVAETLVDTAVKAGGNPVSVCAAFVRSAGEARLFALDWWRPVRTFLLYIVFLFAFAVGIVAYFLTKVLPVFWQFSRGVGLHNGGAAGWIMSNGGLRLIMPLFIMAMLLLVLATVLYWMRLRIAGLKPLGGMARWPWLYGRSGSAYCVLLYLEYVSVLHQGGVPGSTALTAALRLIHWPAGKIFRDGRAPIGEQLEQAVRLDTFVDELDWQRRLIWSRAQAQLELSRDRLILFSRVVFYALIGYLVTVLYLPIFTIATMFWR
jgi:hypothetical protein